MTELLQGRLPRDVEVTDLDRPRQQISLRVRERYLVAGPRERLAVDRVDVDGQVDFGARLPELVERVPAREQHLHRPTVTVRLPFQEDAVRVDRRLVDVDVRLVCRVVHAVEAFVAVLGDQSRAGNGVVDAESGLERLELALRGPEDTPERYRGRGVHVLDCHVHPRRVL
nr:hypothetical protein [Halorubellus salinus]